MINKVLRFFFYGIVVRFVVTVILGLNVRHRERLPRTGPALIIANHNSHLDTMVLMTLLPYRLLPITRPVAAMDYFLRNRLLGWFALKVVGILPIKRKRENQKEDVLAPCHAALAAGQILIFFPEGSRGEPEQLSEFKKGVSIIAERHPHVPVIPVYLHGLGKALPKGEALLVPFFCDVFVGEPIPWSGDRQSYMQAIRGAFAELAPGSKWR
jgi:1-acyl-sn-glycerol-3-phosphate acyltransferase